MGIHSHTCLSNIYVWVTGETKIEKGAYRLRRTLTWEEQTPAQTGEVPDWQRHSGRR